MKRRWWVIRGVLAGLVVASLVIFGGCEGDLPQDSIAQVGQSFISTKDFEELRSLYEAVGRAPDKDTQEDEYRRFEQGVAEYLVQLEVLRQEASTLGIDITDADIQASVAQIKQMFQGSETKFEEALKKQGLSLEQFTEQAREQLLIVRTKAAVTAEVKVTEAEVKAYYEANPDDYIQPEEREVRHILVAVSSKDGAPAGQAEWDAAKREAGKIRSEIQNGADFRATAEKYSDDQATRASGGKLGAVTSGQTVPAFEQAVFSLKKGQLSEPVKTQYGYHIIEVTEIRPEEPLSFDRVKEGIRAALLEQKTEQAWRTWLAAKEAALGVVYASGLEPEKRVTIEAPSDDQTASTTASDGGSPAKQQSPTDEEDMGGGSDSAAAAGR